MKSRILLLAALVAAAATQIMADTLVTIAPTGAAAATVANRWTIGSNLAGLGYIDGNSGFPGATATNFFTVHGAAIPALGAPAGFNSYLPSGAATPQASVGNSLTPDSYSGLTYVAENLGLIGPLSFYAIHHRATGDYLALIQPSVPTVSDQKPMSAPGNPLTPGDSGYFALSYAADNPGGWGATLFYYLRENGIGETIFGSMIPALLSGPTDRWNLGAGRGFTDLAYTSTNVGFGFGPSQFYYLRLDPLTQTTFFGRLDPLTGIATDIQDLGGVYRTLVFTPTDVGYGPNNFYSIGRAAQSIAFAPLADRTACDVPFAFVLPTASSALTVTLAVTGPATILGNVITLTGTTGTVVITASQAGDANFASAPSVARSFAVTACVGPPPPLTPQSIAFAALPGHTACDAPFTFVLPTATSGLPVTLAVTGPATILGNVVTLTGAVGTVVVTASQAGDGTFAAATDVAQSFSVAACIVLPPPPAAQSIVFSAIADRGLCDGSFTVNPTASSGLPVTLVVTSGPATVSGTTVTLTGAGTVTLRATQAGDSDFESATPVSRTFAAEKCAATINLDHLTKPYYGPGYAPPVPKYTTNPPGLLVTFTYDGSPTSPSALGSYKVVATIDSAIYAGSITATFTLIPDPRVDQTVSFGAVPITNHVVGDAPFTLSPTASSGMPTTLAVLSGPATVSGNTVTLTGAGTVVLEVAQAGNIATHVYASLTQSFVVAPAPIGVSTAGGATTLSVGLAAGSGATYQWQKNASNLSGETSSTLALGTIRAEDSGLYTAVVTAGTTSVSQPSIVGVTSANKFTEMAAEVGANIVHANGLIYDQMLLQGPAVAITADPNQVVRLSFVDLSNDIVQVEFSGAGTLSLTLANATGPAPAAFYEQPGVAYMKGHASIVIVGADETSHLTVFSVGRRNAINQALFRDEVAYDGVADLALIAIQSRNGNFGGLRTANVSYFAARGYTGVFAPGVTFNGPVYVGDITAHDSARPIFQVGAAADARIAGGNLMQDNAAPVQVSGLARLVFTAGTDSHGREQPAQVNAGVLLQDGVNVTAQVVVRATP